MVRCTMCKFEVDGEYVQGKPDKNGNPSYEICIKCWKNLKEILKRLEEQRDKDNA